MRSPSDPIRHNYVHHTTIHSSQNHWELWNSHSLEWRGDFVVINVKIRKLQEESQGRIIILTGTRATVDNTSVEFKLKRDSFCSGITECVKRPGMPSIRLPSLHVPAELQSSRLFTITTNTRTVPPSPLSVATTEFHITLQSTWSHFKSCGTWWLPHQLRPISQQGKRLVVRYVGNGPVENYGALNGCNGSGIDREQCNHRRQSITIDNRLMWQWRKSCSSWQFQAGGAFFYCTTRTKQ